jgi:hypothetical protein
MTDGQVNIEQRSLDDTTSPPTKNIALKGLEAPKKETDEDDEREILEMLKSPVPQYWVQSKEAGQPRNKRLAKQFSKEGKMELMLKHRRVHLLLHRQALRGEKRKRSRY